jgi:hypothetical protein
MHSPRACRTLYARARWADLSLEDVAGTALDLFPPSLLAGTT